MVQIELAPDRVPAEDPYALTGIRIGDVLVGKYRVDAWLGVGGMGAVLAATHLQLDDRVAIKVLLPATLDIPEAVTRFDREGRAAARIKSEHVVRVTDVGHLPPHVPYLVMEYLEGADLSSILEERGPLPETAVIGYLCQACRGVAAAHAQGVVHRDLKPSNLFLAKRADGSQILKVLDFGVAKLVYPHSSTLNVTLPRQHIGTPDYMSPEQLTSSRDVDGRTDLWSLGVIAYELLAGRAPFEAKNTLELRWKILEEAPPALSSLRPGISPELEAVIVRCLEKDPARRYADAHELLAALENTLDPVIQVEPRPQRRRLLATLALGLVLSVLLVLAGALAFDQADEPELAVSGGSPASPAPTTPPLHDASAAIVSVEELPVERPTPPRERAKPRRRATRRLQGGAARPDTVAPIMVSAPAKPRSPEVLLVDRE